MNGRRETKNLNKRKPDEICQWVEHFRTRSGVQIVETMKFHHTDTPSTQGIWHPFMFRETETAIAQFPKEELSKIKKVGMSATDYIQMEQLQISPPNHSD